ncbi:ankyrin repeat protein, putative [Trichomonas vaginalis G3]|uniref:Ankyrin repeat protein, putative n=1 Tax=Trichomonas vaginalis (strain ATCC PRA-98 / G3) TaxID=412133 RepID=A2DIE2_TRIV3|nr:hypothetical protein TVAGG3_0601620 [Trichomonas vaginalis G3]EAY19746.1 ankyrin repeat protein, putative [Trichomonas vaginalis G3]KAI5523956.1 hypothetical protein TVAGG3_0601620 [Trichomonas vaginalis G3]|eukprot:XP_001580732.1 ankyrin repeat protein [Trichomonas vaginalis G3]
MLNVMGASLKILNTEKQTPLHIACEMGNVEVVQLLLSLGVQTAAKDVNGMTAYDFAKRSEYQDILDILNEYDVNKINEVG